MLIYIHTRVCVPASMYADIYIVIHCMIHLFNDFDCMCTRASTCIYLYIYIDTHKTHTYIYIHNTCGNRERCVCMYMDMG
jgi:hypothetical protein